MEEPIYRCPQDEFYLAAFLMLNSLEDDLDYFVLLKPKYNTTFVNALRQELIDAELMPDNEQRTEPVKRLRNALVEKTDDDCTERLEALRSYIDEAYTNPLDADSALQEAGFNLYNDATHYDWEALRSIMNKSNTFITDNTALLQANENMPPDFPGFFQILKDEVTAQINTYLNRKENTKQGTRDKNVTNNALYRKLMKIGKDGQIVWRKDQTRAQQYIWDRVLQVVTPPGAAGLRGSVKTNLTFLPIVGATITMQNQGNPAVIFTTNQQGKYDSGNLPIGIYSIKVESPGFTKIETEIEIKLGTISYKHWLLSNQIVNQGNLDIGNTANIDFGDIDVDDATATLEATDTTMSFFASNTPNGGQTGPAAITVNPGSPFQNKVSEMIAQLGLGPANPYFNVQNVGGSFGGWKVTIEM